MATTGKLPACAQQANHRHTRLRADVRGEYDDGQIVTLALARRGEGNCRQVTSTRREGDVRQVNLEKYNY